MKTLIQFAWLGLRRRLREPRVIWRSENNLIQITIEIRRWLPFLLFPVLVGWYVAMPVAVTLMSAVALGGVLIAATLWARALARGVRGQRRLRFAAMQVGDELEEQIFMENNAVIPALWAEFVDRSNIPGYTVTSARAADPKSAIAWRAHTVCTRRGVYQLGPWELRLGDPFGLLAVRQVYLEHQEILVYPPLAALPEHILPHYGAMGDHRPLNQPLRAETITSNSVRAYVPGDPLRHIHWRTTARRGEPFVKQFAPEAASNVWLIADFDERVHTGEGDFSSQEAMVTVVVSLAARLLQQNLSVGLLASAGEEVVVLPRQGQTHLWSILQAIAPLHTVPERPLEDVLQRAKTLVAGNDLLVLVTPSLRSDWIAPLRRIARSRGGSGRAEVVLLDPDSFRSAGEQLPAKHAATAETFLPVLMENGIPANLLRRDDLHLISGFYGEISRWEFSVLGTGRAIARRAPRAAIPVLDSAPARPWKARG